MSLTPRGKMTNYLLNKKIPPWVFYSIIIFVVVTPLFFSVNKSTDSYRQRRPCLSDDEQVEYDIRSFGTEGIMEIKVYDNKIEFAKARSVFEISAWIDPEYLPEIHKCGIYVIRSFNYRIKDHKLAPSASVELWKYNYDGKGEKIMILARTDKDGNYENYFHFSFSIDDTETLIALERKTGGNQEHQLVIRNLNTGEEKIPFTGWSFYNTGIEIDDFEPINWDQGKLLVQIVGRLFITDIEVSEPYLTNSWHVKTKHEKNQAEAKQYIKIRDEIYSKIVVNIDNASPLTNHSDCLTENEFALNKEYSKQVEKYPGSITEEIIVYDSKNINKISNFLIPDVESNAYNILLQPCGVYAIRTFNNESINYGRSPGAAAELWHYFYNGSGRKLLTIDESDIRGRYRSYFGNMFSVDKNEEFLFLERGYSGTDDHAIVSKRLDTLQDIFVLPIEEILEKLPGIYGYPEFSNWNSNGQYLWGSISFATESYARFRIDTSDWSYEVFSISDEKFNGGGMVEPNTGWMEYDTGSIWTGDGLSDEAIRQARKKEGKSSDLHIYNLFTKEDRLIESTKEDPIWFYKPEWISEGELKYQMPSEQWKIYNLKTGEYKLIETAQ